MNKEKIAQWVIDNRYPKSENNKVSDAVMYQTIIDMISTTPAQPDLSADDIIDRIIYSQTDGEEYACIKKEDCISAMEEYRNQSAQVTPPIPPQEEAERLCNIYKHLDFEDTVIRAIDILNYTISALQLRSLSTVYEEEVLTILKGM